VVSEPERRIPLDRIPTNQLAAALVVQRRHAELDQQSRGCTVSSTSAIAAELVLTQRTVH